MGKLKINQHMISPDMADALTKLCPFGAISYEKGEANISSACKMCKLCVRKSEGIIEYVEDTVKEIDKDLWKGICVYADVQADSIHKVTFELCGKARELAAVTGHPVYALLIGHKVEAHAKTLLKYGVD